MLSLVLLTLASCSGDDADEEGRGTLTVAAAASLSDAFTRIGEDFEAAHPGVEVTFTFDSSSTLAAQIVEGAPADVYASADPSDLDRLRRDGLVRDVEVFAGNELVVVTAPGNPEGIRGLGDLVGVGVVALCGSDVPCGRYAGQALDRAGVALPESQVTRGQNVTATLTAVSDGDAVAGIVYASDAVRAGDAVDTVAIPEDRNVVAGYPIGVVAATADAELADAFVAHVLGADGQRVLDELGFLPAP
ncbi:molybdate ABC transporter substrate-binding protein [Actinomarinicola tropica]|uniref:Molybdate ABC transporter substrate-binding protein n=1 Tax=Actinomarinicola tropica TaxID=2789776 RepID=A0A5Q2RM82_9ACTN|nr:molybdate ABC transporter substrate-binding protein [Actinomarinicola tropica]